MTSQTRTPPWGDLSAAARDRESAHGIERGQRVMANEHCENTHGRSEVPTRAQLARVAGYAKQRGRSR